MDAWIPAVAQARLPPWLQDNGFSDAVVSISVYRDDGASAEGAGVVVGAEGYVLTSAAVLDAGRRVTVSASGDTELAADVRLKEKKSGLGILKIEGLSSVGLPLSAETPALGIRIFSVMPETETGDLSVAAGAIGGIEVRNRSEGDINFFRHNAMIAARSYGSPVIDECGRVVALNIPDPQAFSFFRPARNKEPKNVVFAVSAKDIAIRLESLGVAVVRADNDCPSAQIRAQQARERAEQAEEEARIAGEQAEQTQLQIESVEEEVRQSRESEERAQQEAQQARERAQQAEAEAQRAEAQLNEAQKRLAQGRQSEKRWRRLTVWGGTAGVLVLLVIVTVWLAFARRKRREIIIAEAKVAGAEREFGEFRRTAEEQPRAASFDCVLTGVDITGAPIALSLGRETLGSRGGAVIGRNPVESGHVVVHPDVSREHLRIYVENDIAYAEDLNSTNGSALNGHALVPGKRSQINDGDELMLGTVSFRIYLKS